MATACAEGEPSKTDKKYAKELTVACQVLRERNKDTGEPAIYRVPLTEGEISMNGTFRTYSFGETPKVIKNHKVIMVVGATGSGKSTLINGMINYILGVDWKDEFRFKLVDEQGAEKKSQAYSQTQVISSYTIYRNKHHKVPYTLTIIDTPGFGDTRGIKQDKAIVEQMREFFSQPQCHQVDHMNAVGFVVQSSQARLTPTQKYIFDSILSLFGVDVKPNILLLVTFCDGKKPAVIDAIQAANIPYSNKEFMFNNSALFARNAKRKADCEGENEDDGTSFGSLFWEMGMTNMKLFFKALEALEPKSLTLSKEVLEERENLENAIKGLTLQTKAIGTKLEQLEKEKALLENHQQQIKENRNFSYEVAVPVKKKIASDKKSMNCVNCHYPCHSPCRRQEKDKAKCCKMDANDHCTVCPDSCSSSDHKPEYFKVRIDWVSEKRTYAEIEKRYKYASGKVPTVAEVIKKLEADVEEHRAGLSALIQKSHKCVEKLREIALKPRPVGVLEYIDLLIVQEKKEGKPNWQSNVKMLEDLKHQENLKEDVAQGGGVQKLWKKFQKVFSP